MHFYARGSGADDVVFSNTSAIPVATARTADADIKNTVILFRIVRIFAFTLFYRIFPSD